MRVDQLVGPFFYTCPGQGKHRLWLYTGSAPAPSGRSCDILAYARAKRIASTTAPRQGHLGVDPREGTEFRRVEITRAESSQHGHHQQQGRQRRQEPEPGTPKPGGRQRRHKRPSGPRRPPGATSPGRAPQGEDPGPQAGAGEGGPGAGDRAGTASPETGRAPPTPAGRGEEPRRASADRPAREAPGEARRAERGPAWGP